MLVSFIIPAHNEEAHLPQTLNAIHDAARALGLDDEVIVADDASTDRTAAVAESLGAKVVSHERRQIAATRNLGARASRGDVLFFIDADTTITAEAVRDAMHALSKGAAGGGASMRFDGTVPFYARAMLFVFNVSARLLRLTGGCFVFCTRAAYDATGGWNESLYASEEIDFAQAVKKHGRFVIVPRGVTTSGRKLRTFTAWEINRVMLRGILKRRRFCEQRENLDLWYGPRRPDPHLSNPPPGKHHLD